MKTAAFALTTAAMLCAGCSSINDSALTASGRDARVYNPQNGRYEWPDEAAGATPRKPRVSLRDTPTKRSAERGGAEPRDGRTYNPQTGRYEWPDARR